MSHPLNRRERFLIGDCKGRKRCAGYWRGVTDGAPDWWLWNQRKRRDTTKLCSCTGCGNPRRHFGERTVQERRHGYGTR